MSKHASTGRHAQTRGYGAAFSLAAVAIVMVLAAVGAVFIPSSAKQKPKILYKTPLGALIHPLFRDAGSSTPTPPVAKSADPPSASPSVPAPITYPAPVYPAPIYPTPIYPTPARTYSAPTPSDPAPTTPNPTPTDLPPVKPLIQPLLGVVSDDPTAWAAATHSNPVLATRYVSMADPLNPRWLHSAMRIANGATPVIELTLPGISLSSVASGGSDKWLNDLRAEIDQIGRPVIIAFGPEANGTWYSWGTQLVPGGSAKPTNATDYVAAYKHVHDTLGTNLITWLWQVSANNWGDPATAPINPYYPGPSYVNWVGFDGYYYASGDTFNKRFGYSLSQIAWTHKPVIIAETAISPLVGQTTEMPADVTDLFNGVRSNNLLGLIYLDLDVCQGECSLYRQDFRIEKYPAALAAFQREASQW